MTTVSEDPIVAAIQEAENVRGPLEGLVERSAIDPGAPFQPEVIEHLVALRSEERSEFEGLRRKLKEAGCRVTELDRAMVQECGGDEARRPTQADILIELAQSAELFHTPDGIGFADLEINGHRETWPIRSKSFRRWIARCFFEETQGAPSSEPLQSALNVIEAQAHFDSPERDVCLRIGECDDRLYLDLANESWQAVEISVDGWEVIDKPPVRFRRTAGMQALPSPQTGGSIDKLRPFLNVQAERDFVLAIAWVLAALRNQGPYPVLVLAGEQGSAKSTFCRILRWLLDPNTAPLRALPRSDHDLFIAARNAHVVAFDNVSSLAPWISDTLCRLATGGGFAVRQLYTDHDEVLFDATRPVILNGIEDIVTRPDLADRALFLTLEPIPEEQRLPEKELWAAMERERPLILGALLDAVVQGLLMLPQTHLDELPRMTDFALWATACEEGLWPEGTFWSAYHGNREEAVDTVIDADPVAGAVRAFLQGRQEWGGTATDLLAELDAVVGVKQSSAKTWPASARALSGRLRRAASFLRNVGIDVTYDREGGRKRARIIRIAVVPENATTTPSAPSAASTTELQSNDTEGLDPPRDANHPETDGADGADANTFYSLAANKEDEMVEVVYKEAELRQLVGKTPEELRAIHAVKQVFDGEILSPNTDDCSNGTEE